MKDYHSICDSLICVTIVRDYALHCMGESSLSAKESNNICNAGLSGNFIICLKSSPVFLYFLQISTADFFMEILLCKADERWPMVEPHTAASR